MSQKISYLSMGLLCFVFLFFAHKANWDLRGGLYELNMDEQVTYGEIVDIYNSTNFDDFVDRVTGGRDQRYGRLVWNIPAIVGFIPYKIGGPSALIYVNRMIPVLLMLTAYLILIFTFLTEPWARFGALFCFILLPYTSYFASMPKPEPLLMFCLALFFWFCLRAKRPLLLAPFLLGLAYGAKISLLPSLPFLVIFYFCLPSLAQISRLRRGLSLFFLFILGWFLCVPRLIQGYWGDYFESTFHGTTHGSDDSSVNFFTWLSTAKQNYFFFEIFAWSGGFLILGLVVVQLQKWLKLNEKFSFLLKPDVFLLGLFFVWCLPIMIAVKRMWGYYLQIGFVFLILSAFMGVRKFSTSENRVLKNISLAFCGLFLISSALFIPQRISAYENLSARSQTAQHQLQIARMNWVRSFFDHLPPKIEGRYNFAMDPNLYRPEGYLINLEDYWGPYTDWDKSWDGLITGRGQLDEPGGPEIPPTNAEYNRFQEARQGYRDHVVQKLEGQCVKEPCYVVYYIDGDLKVYLRKDIYNILPPATSIAPAAH